MTRKHRVWVLLAGLTGVAAWAGVVAPSAHANQYPTIVLNIGQTVSHTYPAIPSVNNKMGTAPSDCQSSSSCDTIPITLNVTKDDLTTHSYTVNVTATWSTTSVNSPAGPQQTDQLGLFFWENPPGNKDSTGADTYDDSSLSSPSPETVSITDPKSVKLDLVVANYSGVNSGYAIEVSAVDNSSPIGPDRSVDTIVDRSDTNQIPVTPSPTTTVPPDTTPPPTVAPVTAGGPTPLSAVTPAADPQLDGLRPADDKTLLGLGASKKIGKVRAAKAGPAGPVSGWQLTIALLIIPAVVALGTLYGWRRHRSAASIT